MPVESEGTAAQNLRLAVVKELRSRKRWVGREPLFPVVACDVARCIIAVVPWAPLCTACRVWAGFHIMKRNAHVPSSELKFMALCA